MAGTHARAPVSCYLADNHRSAWQRRCNLSRRQLTMQRFPLVGPSICQAAAENSSMTDAQEERVGEDLSQEYSQDMQSRMGGTLTYVHERGMNFDYILRHLIVGSCPQTPDDVDVLADREGVGTILCLQEDSDMTYFSLDLAPILERCRARADIVHIRHRIRDFDPFSLRQQLPHAVAKLVHAERSGRGKLYVHCTAGMGRAPGTALAYMFWCAGFGLLEGHELLTRLRPCHPKLTAIRAATCDILVDEGQESEVVIALRTSTPVQQVQVAGLDVGWGQRLDLQHDAATGRWLLKRRLPPGRFLYKFVFDGQHWTTSMDHPNVVDGDNLNNYVEVAGDMSRPQVNAARERLLSEECRLTESERTRLVTWLEGRGSELMN